MAPTRNSFARYLYAVVVLTTALFSAALPARATIGVSFQMQLGNPSNATADSNNHNHYLIQRTVEALDYSDNLGQPVWASWDLTSGDVGNATRLTTYITDTNLPSNFYRLIDNDYNGVGAINYNRGHLCPSEDRTDTDANNDMLFFLSNIMPQAADNNQGVWGNFEGDCRTLANSGNELLIICGPSGFGTNRIPSGKAVIADYTWKVAVVVPLGAGTALSRITTATRVICLKIPNSNGVSSVWQNYVTSAKQIQVDTGFTFFTALPSNLAWVLRSKIDGQTPAAPANIGFSPTTGATNTSVVITGTNLDSTTNITFNGISAAFTINSPGQVTATVPFGATSGHVSVATLGGTSTTSSNFTVTGSSIVDLAVTTTHTGSFIQGDTGDTYIIVVTNVGTAATVGTVTVVDTLPAGLTATAIGGSGWTANLGTLTCTRSDSLTGNASYPPITVTVNVSGSAPASVTNTVTVSGGGDANSANNTATDPTTINSTATSPTIASQPQPQTVNVGQTATFDVTANGTAPLGYQWLFNGSSIAGASLSSYSRSNVQLADGGNYSVIVSNSAGTMISSNALLTVINPGGGLSTNVIAQWNFNSNPSDTNTSTGSTVPSTGSGTLTLVGGTSQLFFGGASDDPALANDNSGFSTASYPAQGIGNKTAGVRFNISTVGYQNIALSWDQRLSGTASKYFRFQYTINGTDFIDYNLVTMTNNGAFEIKTNNLFSLSGVNNNPNFGFRILAEFESTATGAGTAGYVTTSVSSYGGSGTVRFDMLTVSGSAIPSATPPSITAQPLSQTAIAGSNVTFSVTASGTAPLVYQWKYNSGNISGATNSTLSLTNVTVAQAGNYSVVITNSAGSAPSSNAVLSIYATTAATVSSFTYSGTQAQFNVTGVPNYSYAVQVSTNLIDWSSIKTNTSPFSFTDTNVVNSPSRFYRTVYLP
ncbi:MAG: non-specific endonuclease [Pedosphaera sp.]|nr:non-specific endonuclease [Pedosphaera sp.]